MLTGLKWLILGVILGSALTGAAVYLYLPKLPLLNLIQLPVALDHKAVELSVLQYTFKGVITEVELLGDGRARLKLDTTDGQLPEFVTLKETEVYRTGEGNQQTLTTVNEIKPQSEATLVMPYNLKEKNWQLLFIIFRPPAK